jgi:tetratricopeptide (TPR) repeat protein
MLPLLFAALLLAPQEPRVEATLSATTVRAGDAFVYQILVASDDDAPSRVLNPYLSSAFEVLRTQDFSETQLSFPGGRTRRFRREIVLVVHTPGVHTIPPAQVDIGGRHYATPELQVVVTGPGPIGGAAAAPGQPRLRVEFVPDTVYVGQQVVLRAEAVIPEGRRPRRGRPPTFETPQPAGFWTQELPDARRSSLRLVGSGVYEVHGFSRAYFPLSAGPRTLEPAAVVYEARQDWFSGTRLERITARDSLRLEVRPLPEAGRPPAFAGAVGRFSLSARLEPRRLRAGEAATLLVEITGEGNVKGLPPPRLPAFAGVEVLPAGDEVESWVSDGIVHGTRRFRWMLVPEAGPAVLELGAVEFAWFDPYERRYYVERSEALELDVQPGVAVAAGPAAGSALALREATAGERLGWVSSRAFVALNVVPVLLLLGFAGVRAARRRPRRRPRGRDATWRAWQVRSGSAALTPDGLRRAFLRSVAEAAELRRTELTEPAQLAARLDAAGIDAAVVDEALRALARLDELRFRGSTWDEATRLACVQELGGTLHRIIGELRAGRSGRVGATAAGAVALLVALVPAAAGALTLDRAPLADFARGVAAFEGGDFAAAAAHFAAHVDASPHDVGAWYNLGAAQLLAGQRGEAIGSWLRVVAASPRDREVRSRLEAVGAARAAAIITPALRLNPNEVRLLAAGLWLLALAGATLILAGRRRHGARLAVAALACLVLIGATAAAHSAQRARTAITIAEPTLLRTAPALRADRLDDVPPGTVLRIAERRAAWLRVEHAGAEGWIDAADVLTP